MTAIERRLAAALADAVAMYDAPGGSAAIMHEGSIHAAATGVLNVETRVAVTTDSVFQIGSITKTLVATMIMRCVEQGSLELDVPVVRYLPDFRVADTVASGMVTIRQLLSHSAGFDGDFFVDCGFGPDAVTGYVARMAELPQMFPPGWGVNYCNAGYVLLGRLLEVVTGTQWDELLQAWIARPLGAPTILTRAEEMIRYRVAVGHVREGGSGANKVPSTLHLPYALGPAGSTTVAGASDLLRFAAAHFLGEAARDSVALLRPETAAAMQEPQSSLPSPQWTLHHRGLGWVIYDWSERIIGHDGGTVGQLSFLRMAPHRGFAMALFVNGGDAKAVYDTLFREFMHDLADVTMPAAPAPPTPPFAANAAVLGRYESMRTRIDVYREGDALKLKTTPKDDNEHERTVEAVMELHPVAEHAYRIYARGNEAPDAIVFHAFDDAGIPGAITIRTRAYKRVAAGSP